MRAAIVLLVLLAVASAQGSCGGDADRRGGHPDCAGKACGASCNPCGPERTCPTLVATACDREGNCAPYTGATPPFCRDPCAGKACGEACTICPPDAPDCVETAVVKACDPAGRCVPAPAACAG